VIRRRDSPESLRSPPRPVTTKVVVGAAAPRRPSMTTTARAVRRRVVSLDRQAPPAAPPRSPPPTTPTSPTTARENAVNVVWLVRRDLRLHDNAALARAAALARERGSRLVVCYIDAPEDDGEAPSTSVDWRAWGRGKEVGSTTTTMPADLARLGVPARAAASWRGGTSWTPGGCSRLWQREALRALDADLRDRYGVGVVWLRGPRLAALLGLLASTGAGDVVLSRRYEPSEVRADARLAAGLTSRGVRLHPVSTLLLREPWEVAIWPGRGKRGGAFGHFGTLTPFLRTCEELGWPEPAFHAPPPTDDLWWVGTPDSLAPGFVVSTVDDLDMVPLPLRSSTGRPIDWTSQILASWPGGFGEAAASSALDAFLSTGGMSRYESDRSFADGRAVSKLSPFLHFGQLSPRVMASRIRRAGGREVSKTFWRRLVWRDLAYWQMWHYPSVGELPLRPAYFDTTLVAGDEERDRVAAWQRGATGYPLVDAGMRELWTTGWMQQNVRMAAAALLVEVLGCDWRHGARWFHDT